MNVRVVKNVVLCPVFTCNWLYRYEAANPDAKARALKAEQEHYEAYHKLGVSK